MRRMKAFAAVLGVVGATFATATPAVADDKANLVERIVAKADPRLMEVLITTRSKAGVPQFKTIKVADVAAAKRVVSDTLGRPGVVAVEMNRLVRATAYNDDLYVYQWPLDSKHFYYPSIYSTTRNDTARPRIAVIDSGVQGRHPDLSGHVISGYSTVGANHSTSQTDDCGHGTHVAGIIGAGLNNDRGIVGLAQRAYIRPVKALRWYSNLLSGSGCAGTGDDVAEAIVWAALGSPTHAQIINMSVEASSPLEAERQAILYAQNRGLVVVAAAGNHPNGNPVYPAGYPNVLGVAAVGPRNTPPYWVRASFSNYGPFVDVAAPGVNIPSTVPSGLNRDCPSNSEWDGGYCFMSGTSMASPYTAATLALAMQHCRWSARTALSWVQRTASSYPSKNYYTGYGFINPRKVLRCGS